MIEIELTYHLLKPDDLKKRLNSISEFVGESVQIDTYYVPAHNNFLAEKPILKWLRLRESGKKNSVTYKKWHGVGGVSCDEYETVVEDAREMKKIFSQLDFKEIVVVEKRRQIWNFKKAEITIDHVKDFGVYIEIEAKGDFKDIKEAEKYLYEILKEIKAEVGDQEFKGYPHRLLEKKGLI